MDYGMAVRSHSSSGTPLRYFREVGKNFYRAPECYVPTREEVVVTAPLSSSPGDIAMARFAPNFLCEVRLPKEWYLAHLAWPMFVVTQLYRQMCLQWACACSSWLFSALLGRSRSSATGCLRMSMTTAMHNKDLHRC